MAGISNHYQGRKHPRVLIRGRLYFIGRQHELMLNR